MSPEEILNGLIVRRYRPDQPFEFDDVEKEWSTQEVLFNVLNTDNWFLGKIEWSCKMKKGMKGDYLTPDDRDEYVLDYIYVNELFFGEGENETEIKDKKTKNLFARYLSTLWDSEYYEVSVDPKILKENNIKNYKNFLLEWGYGGEGGNPSKDPVRVSTKMIDSIKIEDDTEDEDKFTYIDDELKVSLNESDDWADPDIYDVPIYLSEDQEKVYSDGTPLERPWVGKNLVLIEKNGKYYVLGDIKYSASGWYMFYEDSIGIEKLRLSEYKGEIKRELTEKEKEDVLVVLSKAHMHTIDLMDDRNGTPYVNILNKIINEGFVRNAFKKKTNS
jgi:hypothetical protein